MAERRDRIDAILGRLANCFGFEAATPEFRLTMEQGVELLQGADARLLSSRTDALTTHDAGRILERAENECRELKQLRDKLVERFDLASLPDRKELQQAARSLNAARRPLLFDGPAKRAMRLYREMSLVRSKTSTEEAASGIRELIEYRDMSARLSEDKEFKRCLGADWRGADSDMASAKRVAGWATEVFQRLAGEGDGRSEARRILLHGEIQRLNEIRRIAEALPVDWQRSDEEPEPSEARERAARLDVVTDGLEAAGLDADEPCASAVDLAALVEEHRSLTAEAESDGSIALVFPSQAPGIETLDMVRMLADAMSGLGLSDESWKQAATFLTQSADVEKSASALRQAFIAASDAWRECVVSLELDAVVFLDGSQHETTRLGALRKRAREALDAQDTLLSWSSYRRACKGVLESHAAPILVALDDHGMSARKLREAYEWALYRSLAARVYRRHPELNGLSSWQLGSYRDAFKGLEARLQDLERARISYELFSRTVDNGVSFGGPSAFTEKALIQHQLSLQRSSVTLRNLLRRAGTALLQMKPCFMMSPTTVAELLPRDSELFDIVVIDEASQMLPCDALGAIARGRQAVIVGDPKQLPPSTYFQGGSAVPMEDDDDEQDAGPDGRVHSGFVAVGRASAEISAVALPFEAQQPDPVLQCPVLRQQVDRVSRAGREPGRQRCSLSPCRRWPCQGRPQPHRSRTRRQCGLRVHGKPREPRPKPCRCRYEPEAARPCQRDARPRNRHEASGGALPQALAEYAVSVHRQKPRNGSGRRARCDLHFGRSTAERKPADPSCVASDRSPIAVEKDV